MITTVLCTLAILALAGPAAAVAPWFIYQILK